MGGGERRTSEEKKRRPSRPPKPEAETLNKLGARAKSRDSRVMRRAKQQFGQCHREAFRVAEEECKLFQRVKAWLGLRFRTSRTVRDLVLSADHSPWSQPCAGVDGAAGAALLTEFKLLLHPGERPSKWVLKCLFLVAAAALHFVRPASAVGCVNLALAPHRRPPQLEGHLQECVLSLPLPEETSRKVLAFAGPLWWSRRAARELPQRQKRFAAYSIFVGCRHRFLKKVFCFPCTHIIFSGGRSLYVEWSCAGDILWLRTDCVDLLVHLLRTERRGGTVTLSIAGFGDVFV